MELINKQFKRMATSCKKRGLKRKPKIPAIIMEDRPCNIVLPAHHHIQSIIYLHNTEIVTSTPSLLSVTVNKEP